MVIAVIIAAVVASNVGCKDTSMAMQYTDVTSSNIEKVGYDDDTETLGVIFGSGTTYHYGGVPKEIYENFISAPSAGQFFHREIMNQYTGEKQ